MHLRLLVPQNVLHELGTDLNIWFSLALILLSRYTKWTNCSCTSDFYCTLNIPVSHHMYISSSSSSLCHPSHLLVHPAIEQRVMRTHGCTRALNGGFIETDSYSREILSAFSMSV